MQRIERLANTSVMRGCAFASLAIWTIIVALSHDPLLAAKTGAILFMMMAAVLHAKAVVAPRTRYQQTELWILLDRRHDLAPEYAQRIIATVLRDTYTRYRDYAMGLAFLFWLTALIFWMA